MLGSTHVVEAEEYEQGIPQVLAAEPTGSVHSVFQNGVNFRMGERLFFVGTTKNGQLPFGIHMSSLAVQKVLETIRKDSLVVWHSARQQLVIDNGLLTICLANAASFHWQVSKQVFSEETQLDNLTMLVTSLLNEPRTTGLEVDIDDFLTVYLGGSGISKRTDEHVCTLLNVLGSNDLEIIETELRFFLGRGQGLTPSGDDHLVGLLAIHAAIDILSHSFMEVLTTLVKKERLTTDIGREYLIYAMEKKFSSNVVELASALTQEIDINMLKPLLSELLDMGHSSGIDTVFGMLLGLLALRRRQG